MASKISYIIIIGIITFTSGKPALKEDTYFVKNEHELRKLLEALANQGKYDMELSYHEDSPESYNDDKARIELREKPLKLYHNDRPLDRYARGSREQVDYDDQVGLNNLQNYNILDKKRGNNNFQRISKKENNILQKLFDVDSENNNLGRGDDDNEYDNADEIMAFLGDLQKNLDDDGHYDGSYRNKNNRVDDRDNRFDDRYDKDNPARNLDDRDDRYDDRYDRNNQGRTRDDRDDRPNDNYNRDNRDRNFDDRDDQFDTRDDRGNRGDQDDRNDQFDNRKDRDYNANRDDRDDRYDNDNYNRDDRDALRTRNDFGRNDRDRGLRTYCRGNKCYVKNKNDISELKVDSDTYIKKYKVNDDMDAVVLGLNDVDRLLTKLNPPKQRSIKQKTAKLLENIDLESLLDRNGNDKKSNVEAVVFDLTQLEDGDVLAKQIQKLLAKNAEPSEADYEEYGNLVEENLKLGSLNLKKKAYKSRAETKIVAHSEDNNNVYVPKWLLSEVLSKAKVRDTNPVQLLKSVIPLTKQQKSRVMRVDSKKIPSPQPPKKIFRRNFEQDVGVPFHLEVQGLGQVKP